MLSILSCFVWLFSVSFGQTILWASGACNYLWGAVIILCMVTLYRYKCSHTDSIQHPILLAIGLFFLGVASGWCNENTSGGALLILLYTFINYCRKHPKQKRHPFQFSGLIGMVIGLCFMVLAPGNSVRTLAVTESERHSGFMRYLARFLQINNNVENYLLWLLAITIIILVHQIFQKKTWNDFDAPVVFAVSSIATSYALIMTVTPMDRAYFGACVFMMISACQSISFLKEEDGFLYTLKYSASILLLFLFFFSYLDNGANLMRIKSALNKRDTYVAEQKAQGHYDLVLTEINPEFENDYTFIFKNDVDEDPESWGCQLYKRYYGLNSVVGTPFIDENE